MDSVNIPQDVQRCQICDVDIVELFCVFCETKLCRRCVGSHMAEDPEKHKIVKHEDCYTTLVLPLCATHPQERCKNFCKECNQAVCSSCVSLDFHTQHKFYSIEKIFREKIDIIKKDTEELEHDILPSYEEIVKQVESTGKELQKDFKTLFDDIEKRRIFWHQEIDRLVNTIKEDAGNMKKKQMKAHNEHLQKLMELLSEVKQSILVNRDILESLEVSKSLSYTNRNLILKQLPTKLEISVPRFYQKPIKRALILEMVGTISGFNISNKKGGYHLKTRSGNVCWSLDEENERLNRKTLLTKGDLLYYKETKVSDPENVALINNDKFWVSNEEGQIQLFRFEPFTFSLGIKIAAWVETVEVRKGPKDIVVTKAGDLVYGKKLSNKINIFENHNAYARVLINLNNWGFLSLCITRYDGLLVCMIDSRRHGCRVVRFEDSRERQYIQYDIEGNNLFSYGKGEKYVKENRNGDVCVADYDGQAVVVTDKAGAFRFRYTGEFIGARNRPMRIVTDSQAHIIVSYINDIHIIDMNGKFLQHLNITDPGIVVSIDSDDNLYLIDNHGTVKEIRYMEKLGMFKAYCRDLAECACRVQNS